MKKGKIVMICGLPGSGKTTLSNELSKGPRTIRLCPDEWIITIGMSDRYMDGKHRPYVESIQWELATQLANKGINVVLENGYWTVKDRTDYAHAASDQGIKTELHFLDIEFEELSRRIENRNRNLPKFALRVSRKELMRWYEQFEAPTIEELKNNYSKYKIYKN